MKDIIRKGMSLDFADENAKILYIAHLIDQALSRPDILSLYYAHTTGKSSLQQSISHDDGDEFLDQDALHTNSTSTICNSDENYNDDDEYNNHNYNDIDISAMMNFPSDVTNSCGLNMLFNNTSNDNTRLPSTLSTVPTITATTTATATTATTTPYPSSTPLQNSQFDCTITFFSSLIHAIPLFCHFHNTEGE
ncbi:hypothetical protein RFI_03507 [Reticulomyxa filosa]|uniref:Uncharacterized protein n=1 Tax=Reticulomyxa filosa TaxID=46433 RepID=X6P4X3_RETFI|nr:hypothetical protein RFI_03507 [Reticulomyxa filosa]|eukprot:ETO33595.1 hypothetical protein RFI_03507 [Reticulomyxa filosa]